MLRSLFLILVVALAPGVACARTLLVYGDSLSAGYGVPREQSWVSLLTQRLQREGYDYKVVNASISGETTRGGMERIAGVLRTHRPAVLILELGANDGLQGKPPDLVRHNLEAIVLACERSGTRVLLVGMRLPPNYGAAYTGKFHQVFTDLARRHKLPLVPFLLDGFAADRKLFQADDLHPTAQAQPMILDTVWPVLKPLLRRSSTDHVTTTPAEPARR